jgi:hypothetical protein
METGSISPDVLWLTTGIGWVVNICNDIEAVAVAAGKDRAGVGRSSNFNVPVELTRKANTAKVTIHANRNPKSAHSKNAWVIVRLVDTSIGESSFNFRWCIKDKWHISLYSHRRIE